MSTSADLMRTLRMLTDERVRQGKTQQDVADRLKVTRQAVAAWESGKAWPTIDNLFFWAAFLGFRFKLEFVAPAADGNPELRGAA